jgi:hypothetical protein
VGAAGARRRAPGDADGRRAAADAPESDIASFRSELAWREFHADVLHHRPGARTRSLRDVVPDDAWATGQAADDAFAAWAGGRTGYPLVDVGRARGRGSTDPVRQRRSSRTWRFTSL